jgi:hypothetical protein
MTKRRKSGLDEFVENVTTLEGRSKRTAHPVRELLFGAISASAFTYACGMSYWLVCMMALYFVYPWMILVAAGGFAVGVPMGLGILMFKRGKRWVALGVALGLSLAVPYVLHMIAGMGNPYQ